MLLFQVRDSLKAFHVLLQTPDPSQALQHRCLPLFRRRVPCSVHGLLFLADNQRRGEHDLRLLMGSSPLLLHACDLRLGPLSAFPVLVPDLVLHLVDCRAKCGEALEGGLLVAIPRLAPSVPEDTFGPLQLLLEHRLALLRPSLDSLFHSTVPIELLLPIEELLVALLFLREAVPLQILDHVVLRRHGLLLPAQLRLQLVDGF
mmetsp:Transcript_120221/g.345577  ORF Transcript_120221/g.345577 Transcript_120221/m.345577 type:complete len:203 (+) Transcript_120221:1351-1959(+)